MIIDAHCHLWQRDHIPEKYWVNTAAMIARIVPGGSPEVILNSELMAKSMDGSAERLLKEMDEAGIDKAVVFGVDWGIPLGEAKIPINDYNKFIAETAKQYPDRLIPFFTIDPRRDKASDLFEKALTTWEMKGLKLHPSTGYLPDGEKCYKLYEIADRYHVPIITHSGYIIGLKGRTARPEYFDAPTTDFPNIKLSFAHLNFGNIDDLVSMMFMKPTIYTDISGHGQILMMNSPPDFYRQLRFTLNHEGVSDRVMFGSDWPSTSNIMPLSKWVKTINDLSDPKVTTILENLGYRRFRSKEIKQVLGTNVEHFLKEK
ncbi:MAG TPA: amidohydrolase family protein [Candidatus Deferrimicrobium sp.]|nr:amidohydrolase family protein [Candidatus Deferrimicrobium sp.]